MTEITMPPPRIGRVSLAVADLDRSVQFYEDVIGLTLISREGEIANMGAGNEHFCCSKANRMRGRFNGQRASITSPSSCRHAATWPERSTTCSRWMAPSPAMPTMTSARPSI